MVVLVVLLEVCDRGISLAMLAIFYACSAYTVYYIKDLTEREVCTVKYQTEVF